MLVQLFNQSYFNNKRNNCLLPILYLNNSNGLKKNAIVE